MDKNQEQSARTISKLLRTAGELFMKNGYEHTTMKDIAELCGLTRGALYHHFTSKEGILDAMCAAHYAGQKEKFTAIIDDDCAPFEERAAQFITLLREYEEADSAFFKTYLQMQASSEPDKMVIKGRFKQYRKGMFRNYVAPLLQQGLEKGIFDFSVTPEEMAMFLLQIEEYITESMACALVYEQENEAYQYRQMENLAFAFSRLLGCETRVVAKMLAHQGGVEHYRHTLC